MRLNTKRRVVPYSRGERSLPTELFYVTNTVSATFNFTAGQSRNITLTSSGNLKKTDLIRHEWTMYEGSEADANRIPGSVSAERWKILHWTDNVNSTDTQVQDWIYTENLADGSESILINSDTDDCEENGGFSSVACRFGDQAGTVYNAGFRFNSVNIPPGATITAATLTFNKLGGGGANILVTTSGVDEDNASTWSASNKPSDVTLTTASVNDTFNSATDPITTGDLATIVQEIIDRSGWSYGNSMAFVVNDNGSAANNWYSPDYHDNSPANSATLAVTYTDDIDIVINARDRILLVGDDRRYI